MDEMFTILPLFWRFMTGATVWQPRKVPSRLNAMRRCQSSNVSSSTVAAGRGMMVLPPTALTRISIRPNSWTISSTAPSTCLGSSASACLACTRPPAALIAATAASSLPASVSTATTVPPSAPMMSAVARPIPLAAAVITATFPPKRTGCPPQAATGAGPFA